MKVKAYCPKCNSRVGTTPHPLTTAGEQLVDCCGRCGNAMIYESKKQYFQSELHRLDRIKNCSHEWEAKTVGPRHDKHTVEHCAFCHLGKGEDPEDIIADAALEWFDDQDLTLEEIAEKEQKRMEQVRNRANA